MQDNNVHTIIDSNGVFSHSDNYKYTVPLFIKGNDPSLSEIAISLSMARDSNYRMPNNLRVYLSSWNNPHSPVAIDLTRVISDHYTSHLRTLFPTRRALDDRLKEQVTTFVRYHSDLLPDSVQKTQVDQYLKSLWDGIPPSNAAFNDIRWDMGNGALGNEFALAHWFTLPHVIVAIPPVQLLESTVGNSIRSLSGDIILEVTSGIPSLTHNDRTLFPEHKYTCGAFRLSVDIAKQNPLTDELKHIRENIEKIIDTQTKHENRLNEHDVKIQKLEGRLSEHDTKIQKHEDLLNEHNTKIQNLDDRFIGHDTELAALKLDVGKLKKWKDDRRTLIEVENSAGDQTILIDGEAGDITIL